MTVIVTAITDVVVPLVEGVFDVIVANPLLTTYVAIGLLGAGITLFATFKQSAQ